LYAVIKNDADLFPLVEQMRLHVICIAAQPERDVERGVVRLFHVVEDVADRQVPIVVNIIDPLASSIRAGGVCAGLRHLHPAGEERRVGALKFVSAP